MDNGILSIVKQTMHLLFCLLPSLHLTGGPEDVGNVTCVRTTSANGRVALATGAGLALMPISGHLGSSAANRSSYNLFAAMAESCARGSDAERVCYITRVQSFSACHRLNR